MKSGYEKLKENKEAYELMLSRQQWNYVRRHVEEDGDVIGADEFRTPDGLIYYAVGCILAMKAALRVKAEAKMLEKAHAAGRNRAKFAGCNLIKKPSRAISREERLRRKRERVAAQKEHYKNWVLCVYPPFPDHIKKQITKEKRLIWARKADKLRPWRRQRQRKTVSELPQELIPAIRKKRAKYMREKRHNCIEFNIACTIRSRLGDAIRSQGARKHSKTMAMLGCTIPELKAHLEKQFKPGMSWSNYGYRGWHIDHIVPLSSFKLSDPEQQRKATHYTNLQPLWRFENQSKSAKVDSPLTPAEAVAA